MEVPGALSEKSDCREGELLLPLSDLFIFILCLELADCCLTLDIFNRKGTFLSALI